MIIASIAMSFFVPALAGKMWEFAFLHTKAILMGFGNAVVTAAYGGSTREILAAFAAGALTFGQGGGFSAVKEAFRAGWAQVGKLAASKAISGAIGGGVRASILGKNIGRGMLVGAAAGGADIIGGRVGEIFGDGKWGHFVGGMTAGGVSGGVVSEITGGKFSDGFKQGLITASISGSLAHASDGLKKLVENASHDDSSDKDAVQVVKKDIRTSGEKAADWAKDQVGKSDYSRSLSLKGGLLYLFRSKCNLFVADAYEKGAEVSFPYRKNSGLRTTPPGADAFANPNNSYGNYKVVNDLQLGDIIAYTKPPGRDHGHLAIYVGNNQVVQARSGGVEMSQINKKQKHIVRRLILE